MTTQTSRAAQYVRMSTDEQDLSPLEQKDVMAAFAATHAFEIVRTYEDDGKSGVGVANRPRLLQLIADVTHKPDFSAILVYDVSRWGRFQDIDAAAYYEYHCRLHGVQVIYVHEPFSNDLAPASALMKSVKRVMAAEYSRDLAGKMRAGQHRAVSMGFQMGALPPFGYRRVSVSADGTQRRELRRGERKPALTDRVEWALGPAEEVALVRRICGWYVSGRAPDEIARLVRLGGWRTARGSVVTPRSIKTLLQDEALIGNFVWGVKRRRPTIVPCTPSRMDGSVPRIIDDATWDAVAARLRTPARSPSERCTGADADALPPCTRRPTQLRLPLLGCWPPLGYRRVCGTPQQLRLHTREFGQALCDALSAAGLAVEFDPKGNVLFFLSTRLRVRLMWPTGAATWHLDRDRSHQQVPHILVARMTQLRCPFDFLLLPAERVLRLLRGEVPREVPRALAPYWCRTPAEVVQRVGEIVRVAAESSRVDSSSLLCAS